MAIKKTSLSPGLSIIIVSFNEKARLTATLSSIPLDIDNIEIILVVPENDSFAMDLVNSKAYGEIKVTHDLGFGVYHAMNLGVRLATLSHLLFLNTGDQITGKNQLQECLSRLKNSTNQSLILPVEVNWSRDIENAIPDLQSFLLGLPNNYVSHQGVLFAKSFAIRKGRFDEKYKVAADFKQLCLLYRDGNFVIENVKLVSIEYPEFSSKNNRRGRFESLLIAIIHLRGSVRVKSLFSRLLGELKSLLNKLS